MLKFLVALYITLAIFCPNFTFASEGVALASVQKFSQEPAWLKLVHYRKGVFGYASEIGGSSFFLSPKGPSDPMAELQATFDSIQASQKNRGSITLAGSELDKQVACVFPARFAVLKKALPEASHWQMPRCPRFEHFYGGINAASATLVFSSYYLNNPASAFGHTFVRLNKDSQGSEHHALLDYGIGFAATAPDANPLAFALGGLIGSFHGDFTNVPYYLKVQEYNDYESRDLWEYDLNLTREEVNLLVAHLWEVSHTVIQYKYLSANCSSLMFTAIDAAAPRLSLSARLPYWVIPSDTVHALFEEPGFVTHYHFRPSKRTQFLARYDRLSDFDKQQIQQLADSKDLLAEIKNLKAEDKTAVLDTFIDYYDFRHFKAILREDPETVARKQTILSARSQLPATGERFEAPEPKSEVPQTGHGSARANIGYLTSKLGERSVLLGQKFALHDFLDRQQGYPRDSTIDFLDLELRILAQASSVDDARGSVKVNNFYAFAVKSFAPYENLIPNKSWKVRIGAERTWDESCANCVAAVVGSGVGYTWDVFDSHKAFATLLLSGDISESTEFSRNNFKVRVGPEFNYRRIFTPNVILQVNMTYLHLFFTEPQDAFRVAEDIRWTLPGNKWALGAGFTILPRAESEIRTQAFYYY